MGGGYDIILENLRLYSGSGLLFILLLVAIVYLGYRFRGSSKKYVFVWYPIAILLVYFCPIWIIYISKRNDSAILYRLLWLIPVGVIVCTALVEFVFSLPDKKRPVAVMLSVLLIVFSGKYTYANTQFLKAENIYHIPEDVVEICETIEIPGREVRACFPDELLQFVRQYNSYIHMTYGRDVFLEGFMRPDAPLRDLLMGECPSAEAIAQEMRNSNTHYLIISKEKEFDQPITDFEFAHFSSVGDYDIYLDERADLSVY